VTDEMRTGVAVWSQRRIEINGRTGLSPGIMAWVHPTEARATEWRFDEVQRVHRQ
jgi:hypothetical protein